MMWTNFRGVVVLATLLVGCSPNSGIPPEYESFLRKAPIERQRGFRERPLSAQVELYLLAATKLKPPDRSLAPILASNGRAAVPVLRAALESQREDRRKADLLYVFLEMQEGHYYDVAGDEELMTILRQHVDSMKDGEPKSWSRGYLEGILEDAHWGKVR